VKPRIFKHMMTRKEIVNLHNKFATGYTRNGRHPWTCRHFNPASFPEPSVERGMSHYAKVSRACDSDKWGVVNPGNALCLAIFRTKQEAIAFRRREASAYVVVRIVVTPLYSGWPEREQDRP